MKTIPTILISVLLLGCTGPKTPSSQTITGFVVEKRANTNSYDSWNAPSDPYYVLETKNTAVTLRPSPSIPTEELATLKGKRVLLKGYHSEGEPYRPTQEGKQYPMEPPALGTNTLNEAVTMRPANRGGGFVVTRILEMK